MSTAEGVVTNQSSKPRLRWLMPLTEWLADWPNPIVVKELRQAVRSWVALAMLVFYLVVQLLVIGIMLMAEVESITREQPVGNQVFLAVQIQLVITTVGLLPLYAGVRLFLERSDVNMDLMFITPLRPIWLVLGKLCAAMVLGLLFFSASAPVMAMAYFLRGLDLLTATTLLVLDLLVMMATVQLALFVAAMTVPRAVAILLGIGLLPIIWAIAAFLWEFSAKSLDGPYYHADVFWGQALSIALTAIFVTMFFFTATHALLSPPPSNRLFAFKLMLLFGPILYWFAVVMVTALYLLLIGGTFRVGFWAEVLERLLQMMEILGPITFTILSWLSWAMAISERLEWGPRLLGQVPRWRLLRILVFPFYTGAANGLVFALLLTGLRWLVLLAIHLLTVGSPHSLWFGVPLTYELGNIPGWHIHLLADIYLMAHALTALWLRRFLERKRGKAPPGWLLITLTVGLVSFVSVLCAVIASLMNLSDRAMNLCFLLAPFPILEATLGEVLLLREREMLYNFASIVVVVWFGAVAFTTLVWWIRQVRLFHPPQPNQSVTQSAIRSSASKE